MRIKKFIIENFQALKGRIEIPIDDDGIINLIVAQTNGAGKTSIIHAFYFLLCNSTLDDIESFINWDSDYMALYIEFEYKGMQFVIDYKYDGKAEKTLSIDKEDTKGPTAVAKKLKEYFDPSIFTNATVLYQGEKNFVKVADSARRDHLKKVFNTDYSVQVKQIEKEKKDIEDTSIKQLDKTLTELKAQKFIDKELLIFNIEESIYTNLVETVIILNNKVAELNSSISNIEKNKKLYADTCKEIETYNAKITLLKNSINTLATEIAALENFIQDFTRLDNLKTQLADIRIERIKAFEEEKLTNIVNEKAAILANMQILKKQLQDCKSGICPTCLKDFDSNDIQGHEKEIADLHVKELEVINTEILIRNEKTEYEKIVKENDTKKSNKELLESQIQNEEIRLQTELNNNVLMINTKKKSKEQNEADLVVKEKELETKNQELLKIEVREATELVVEKTTCEKQVSENSLLIKEYERIKTTNTIIEKDNKDNVQKRIDNKAAIDTKQKELDTLYEKIDGLKKMIDFLRKEFPSYVISSTIQGIQDSMNEFISKVYYKSLDVEIKGDDDIIQVLYGSGKRKVDCIHSSGAEEALLSIAYTVALNKLNNYNIMFIDEIDCNMTEDTSLQLAEIIVNMQKEFEQLWCISHVAKTKDYYSLMGANLVNMDQLVA